MVFNLPKFDEKLYSGDNPNAWNPEKLASLYSFFRYFSKYYCPTTFTGWENIPEKGPLFLVANHNGGFGSPDTIALWVSWYDRFKDKKPLYALATDIIMKSSKTMCEIMSLAGAMRATKENGLKILKDKKESLLVYPGGGTELFRSYKDRNKIDFAGHKGFVKMALETQSPILPVITVGSHESIFVISSNRNLMKYTGLSKKKLPVWPIMFAAPWGLVAIPLPNIPFPTKVHIHFDPIIDVRQYGDESAAKDPKIVDFIYNKVYWHMQAKMTDLVEKKKKNLFI